MLISALNMNQTAASLLKGRKRHVGYIINPKSSTFFLISDKILTK